MGASENAVQDGRVAVHGPASLDFHGVKFA